MEMNVTLDYGPDYPLKPLGDMLEHMSSEVLPFVAQECANYMKGNIDAQAYPASPASSDRDTAYKHLDPKTIETKRAIGSPFVEIANKRWGNLYDAIHLRAIGPNEIEIVCNPQRAGEMGRAKKMGLSKIQAAMKTIIEPSFRTATKSEARQFAKEYLAKAFPGATKAGIQELVPSVMGRFTKKLIPTESASKEDIIASAKKMARLAWESIARPFGSIVRGPQWMESYAGYVNAKRPFMIIPKSEVNRITAKYMDKALRQRMPALKETGFGPEFGY